MATQNQHRAERHSARKQFEEASKSIFYYYARTPARRGHAMKKVGGSEPIVTFCLVISGDNAYRGIAICSVQDSPNTKHGRGIAFGRAWKAFRNEENALPINYNENVKLQNALSRCDTALPEDFVDVFGFKSAVNPTLTQYEKHLIDGINAQT